MAATSRLWSHLRRSRPRFSFLSSAPPLSPRPHSRSQPHSDPCSLHLPFLQFGRRFSSAPSGADDGDGDGDFGFRGFGESTAFVPDVARGGGIDGVIEGAASGVEESILPVKALISLLDSYHDVTGLPWWVVIASSTLALRVALFPVLVLQLKKLKRISELFPKLPPPLPPPFSGRSYINQISLFRRESQASGCPSLLWFLAYLSVQVPFFLLWMTSIRRMSLDHHPGFDCGGILWFQNLSELPHGTLGHILPLLIAGLHFMNVQVSFSRKEVREVSGVFGLLAKIYKYYLYFMSAPILYIGHCIPQGSLVYWVTNASMTLFQQIALKHPAVRLKLGLLAEDMSKAVAKPEEMATSHPPSNSSIEQSEVPVQNLSPRQLHALSVVLIAKGQIYQAIPLLELALEKDPECVSAMIGLGQALLQDEEPVEAAEHLERAISKIFVAHYLTEAEYTDLLVGASQWAGFAYLKQGKKDEALRHLERIPLLKEPVEPKSREIYYDGLVLLAVCLSIEGRKAEAAKYLRLAVAYDSSHKYLLENLEKDDDNLVNDLVNSRRADY
ncbi:hypothetical protein BT93_B1026 [Corymbia citriodora subsp. variegata]|nr:hypothetical protein BT93_B1026 [Corymbia citriodora subsp. variegata]